MTARVVLIFTILIHISLGLYIRPAKENKTMNRVMENMKNDASEWKMFQQMLNLTDKKGNNNRVRKYIIIIICTISVTLPGK